MTITTTDQLLKRLNELLALQTRERDWIIWPNQTFGFLGKLDGILRTHMNVELLTASVIRAEQCETVEEFLDKSRFALTTPISANTGLGAAIASIHYEESQRHFTVLQQLIRGTQ